MRGTAPAAAGLAPAREPLGASLDDRGWRQLRIWSLLMCLALLVPFEWDLLIPGVVLFFVPLLEVAAGVSYTGTILSLTPFLLGAMGAVVVVSCFMVVQGILRRDMGRVLAATCVYTCQGALFLVGLQMLFIQPYAPPRLVHPAALLVVSGVGPAWLILRSLLPGASRDARIRWLVIVVFGVCASAALAFALSAVVWGSYALWASGLWIFSLVFSLVVAITMWLVLPGHRAPPHGATTVARAQ